MTVQTITIPQLTATPGTVTQNDILMAFRASMPAGMQDIQIPFGDILSSILFAVNVQNQSLIITLNNTVNALANKIDVSEKGAANGVATLGPDGLIDPSQINLSGTQFKGNWDATTNTPTLVDGTGTAGDFYIVTFGTSRDLGSGSVAWSDNAYILYDGAKWIENESTNIILTVNGQTGPVVLTTNDIADYLDKRYVTETEKEALIGTYGTPSSTNRYVTDSDPRLNGGGTYVGYTPFGPHLFEHNGIKSGDAQFKSLAFLGLTDAAAQAKWPKTHAYWQTGMAGGIVAADANYADVVLQEMMLTMENGYKTAHFPDDGYYYLSLNNGHIKLPTKVNNNTYRNNFKAQQFNFKFNGSAFRNYSGRTDTIIFDRYPADQTDAENNYLDTHIRMNDGVFIGARMTNQVGMRIAATYNMMIQSCEFFDFDYGFKSHFVLNSKIDNCMTTYCKSWGLYNNIPTWSGIPNPTKVVSQLKVYDTRVKTILNGSGMYFRGGDGSGVWNSVVETGNDPADIGIYYDNAGNTVAKDFTTYKTHFEGSFTTAMNYMRLSANCTTIHDQDWPQAPGSKYLFLENVSGSNVVKIMNMPNTSGADWTLGYSYAGSIPGSTGGNGAFIFEDTMLPTQPNTEADIVGNFSIFDNNFSSPQNVQNRIKLDKRPL